MLAIVNNTPASFEHASTMSYEERCQCLSANGYAVWDVLAHCYRPGSLDSNIVRNTEKANDIASLVQRHPNLHRIAFNGKTAQALFRRHVTLPKPYTLVSLPSSSPAMASLTLSQKHQRWAEGLLG